MLRRTNLSWLITSAMLIWLFVLGTRLLFGNQIWQDPLQIVVGVLFSIYGWALAKNWQSAATSTVTREGNKRDTSSAHNSKQDRNRLSGYLWMFGGIMLTISAIGLFVAQMQ